MTTTSTTTTSTIPPKQPLPDHYYFSDHDESSEYYDNVDEISIPSSSPPIKHLNNHNKRNHSSSSSIKTSSSTLSQSTAPAFIYVRPKEVPHPNRLPFNKFSDYSESRYDQSTLKSFFMQSSVPTTEKLILTTEKPTTTTTTEKIQTFTNFGRDFEVQRQKILSFIISEHQPSSFKAPSTTTTHKPLVLATNQEINSNNANYFRAFVNTQAHESTTISHPNTTSTNSPRTQNNYQNPTKTTLLLSRDQVVPNKSIRLTLSPSVEPIRQKYSQIVDVAPVVRSRPQEPRLHLKPIEPTTYSPQKPFRVTTESTTTTSEAPSSFPLDDDPSEMDPFVIHSRRRPYVNDFLTNSNIPTRFPPRVTTTTEIPVEFNEFTTEVPTTTTTFRSVIQTFTSRGLVFKENFNRTYEPQSLKPIISPYISLETQRLTNAIRTTTPRQNEFSISKQSSSTTLPPALSTYRSYFLITQPIKDKSSVPSTFLFPETSSTQSSSILTTTTTPSTMKPSPFVVNTESNFNPSSENSRGRYRPYVAFTSQNSIDEEATTYAPRLRYNTKTQTMVDTVSTSSPPTDQPVVRRKIIRLKSSLTAPSKPVDIYNPSTDNNRIDITTVTSTSLSTPLREISPRFVASPPRESNQFRPLVSKPSGSDFVSSYKSDAASKTNSFNKLPKDEPTVEITDDEKPFYYIRFKNTTNLEPLLETSTKRFRATVEMPEMNVPTEKELNAFVDAVHEEEVYDEEEIIHHPISLDIIENEKNGEHEVDYAYVESLVTSTTVAPIKLQFNTTYSPVYSTSTSTYQPKTSTLTAPSLRTTETTTTTTTTANPKSLIPPRTSRVNSAIKTSIVAGLPRRNSASSIKCNDISANAKCNEIPSRYYSKKKNQPKNQTKTLFLSIR